MRDHVRGTNQLRGLINSLVPAYNMRILSPAVFSRRLASFSQMYPGFCTRCLTQTDRGRRCYCWMPSSAYMYVRGSEQVPVKYYRLSLTGGTKISCSRRSHVCSNILPGVVSGEDYHPRLFFPISNTFPAPGATKGQKLDYGPIGSE